MREFRDKKTLIGSLKGCKIIAWGNAPGKKRVWKTRL